MPVPLSVTMLASLEASLTTETPPESAPADFGANTTIGDTRYPERW